MASSSSQQLHAEAGVGEWIHLGSGAKERYRLLGGGLRELRLASNPTDKQGNDLQV